MATETSNKNILEIKDLYLNFYTYEGVVKALDGITLDIKRNESLGLVGETGCGKSVTVRSIMRLIEVPGKIEGGEIFYNNKDILQMPEKEMRKIRGNKISMIFQDPMTFLNPVMKVGTQVGEVILLHQELPEVRMESKDKLDKKKLEGVLKEKVTEIFKMVRLPDAESIYSRYPHELSGGMRQRILIAMAIASNPSIIIADEATTALDVTIQAQILDLMNFLKEELDTTLIFVTHNMGIVAEMCDRVVVLYGGQVAEISQTKELFSNPIHPYTVGLLRAIPQITKPVDELTSIRGVVPNLVHPPPGCRFNPRCDFAEEICSEEKPKLVDVGNGHIFACHVRAREYKHTVVGD
ncbi:MAG: ABC transporter ATP-binding protein [Candidatus Hodarchaeales archaeon]|jgi:oligopeptide/dipeptide ABC transporter ATP-binding protein